MTYSMYHHRNNKIQLSDETKKGVHTPQSARYIKKTTG